MTTLTESMNWGTELWDQYDNLSVHTLKGIEFMEKYGHFVRDRATIEYEYAAKLSPVDGIDNGKQEIRPE